MFEQLQHDRGHAAEVAGAALALEGRRHGPDVHRGRGARPVHLRGRRHEQEIAAGGAQQRAVAFEVARVGREVLARAELGGVHEEGDRDVRVLAAGALDQRDVSLVQEAHGRYEADLARERRPPGAHSRDGRGLVQDSALRTPTAERSRTCRASCALTGVGTPRRRPSRSTAPFRNSISVGSAAVDVLQHGRAVRDRAPRDRERVDRGVAGQRDAPGPRDRGHLAGGRLRERARLRIVEHGPVGDVEHGGHRVERAVDGELAPDVRLQVGDGLGRHARARQGVRQGRNVR